MLAANDPVSNNTKYEVINAGVPILMRTLAQNFLARILFYQPDMVVIYEATNDLARYGNETGLNHPLENSGLFQKESQRVFWTTLWGGPMCFRSCGLRSERVYTVVWLQDFLTRLVPAHPLQKMGA